MAAPTLDPWRTAVWANPGVQVGSTSLTNGHVTNTIGDLRIMQFAIKYGF